MSIFSSIRKSRQSAKSHNAKMAEQKKMEESATPYRHVPTHAASDAIASAPPSWREADKVRIVEENRRRSAMAASGHHMNMPGTPRIGSSLSYVAYPSDGTGSPMVPPLPRAYSHTGMPTPSNQAMYGVPQMAYSQPYSLKGKEVTRWPIYETPDQDPGYGKDAQSVAESTSESSSSRDNLEMRSSYSNTHAIGMAETRWQPQPSPTRSRRKSDPLTEQLSGVNPGRTNNVIATSRDSGPPPSTRGFHAIPPSAVPPTVLSTKLPGHLTAISIPSASPGLAVSPSLSPTANSELAVQPPVVQASRVSSTASLPALTPTSSRVPQSMPGTPGMNATSSVEFPFPAVGSPTTESSTTIPFMNHGSAVQSPKAPQEHGKSKERRASRPTRFTELERIESAPEGSHHSVPRINSKESPPLLPHAQVVNMFPEAVPAAAETDDGRSIKSTRSKKSRKGGNKLVKKQRVPRSASGR